MSYFSLFFWRNNQLVCTQFSHFRKQVFPRIFQPIIFYFSLTVSEYCRNTGTSTRRRMMTQHCWNEMHELHPLKWRMSQRGNKNKLKQEQHKLKVSPWEEEKREMPEYPEGMWILIAWIAQNANKKKRISHVQSEVYKFFSSS